MPVTFRLLSLSDLLSLCSSFFLSEPPMPKLKIRCVQLPSLARWAQLATVAIQICDSLVYGGSKLGQYCFASSRTVLIFVEDGIIRFLQSRMKHRVTDNSEASFIINDSSGHE
uniref:Putative secreted protein n=1 Tax=Ixodes ricinus TaxID=34613 RepID=A0A6B0UKI4_IXORI